MWGCCSADEFPANSHIQHHDFAHYSQDHMPCFQPPAIPSEKFSDSNPITTNFDVKYHHHHHHHHVHQQHCHDHQQHCHDHHTHDHHISHHCHYYVDRNQANHVPDVTQAEIPCQFNWNLGSCPPQCEDRLPEMGIDEPDKKKILQEIHEECEHMLAKDDCASCHIKFGDNSDVKAIPLSKLVNIVLMSAGASLDDVSRAASALCRKREQNKEAASKYRDRQKNKWRQLTEEKSELEEKNDKLKKTVLALEKEVTEIRRKLLNQ